ncbi:helix-turn-helix domain-containing protein [Allorhizocola rhizosphaerae]|uniref:helix-turn-helix domain-containing protein n=1 Tax=Allorhizocola rhizosphaerae TaxID=1872709 RepID=UPI000E3D5EF0|nr:helix-turn-helix domain-containing protein [Allorhizocola rhizosphaerae]
MASDIELPLGRRIELARRRRGLSREILGDLIGRSSEWVRQVERGDRPVDRLSLLLLLAKVLKVSDPPSFLGCAMPKADPAAPPPGLVESLRDTLYRPPAAPRRSVDQLELRTRLDDIWTDWHESPHPYSTTLQRLPALISALSTVEGSDDLIANAHRLASAVLRRLGDLPAALLASERAVAAARRSGDPLAEAACIDGFGNTLARLGSPAQARQVCLIAASTLDADDVAHLCVQGALHLTAAEAAVADDDHLVGERLLDRARATAVRLGEDRNDYSCAFGPTGVQIHAVRISLRQGRVRQALRLAETVDVQRVPARERRSRHYITVARAHARQDNTAAMVLALLKAEDMCPEEIRYNREARAVLRDLLQRDDALIRTDVLALAQRTGLT